MTDTSKIAGSIVDGLLASGAKILDVTERASKISLTAVKQMMDSQIELGSALADLSATQLKGFGDVNASQDVMHRQNDTASAFGAKLQTYFEQVRGVAQEAQQAWVQLGQEVTADLGKGFKTNA